MKSQIKHRIEFHAKEIASWLNKKIHRWSDLQKKIGVAVFSLLFSGFSLYILVTTIVQSPVRPSAAVIKLPRVPSHIGKTQKTENYPLIPKALFDRIEAFKNSDSLGRTRQGLLDTIHEFEHIYPKISRIFKKAQIPDAFANYDAAIYNNFFHSSRRG
jgi:hypothetical protein